MQKSPLAQPRGVETGRVRPWWPVSTPRGCASGDFLRGVKIARPPPDPPWLNVLLWARGGVGKYLFFNLIFFKYDTKVNILPIFTNIYKYVYLQ